MTSLRVAVWNLEWAGPRSRRADLIRAALSDAAPDILCLTEVHVDTLPPGHQVESKADYGYALREGRRKVVLRSRWPWREADAVGDAALPPGRFVEAVTDTPLGPVAVTGLCVPWSAAHVTTGRRDRRRWEDHLAFLGGLAALLRVPRPHPHLVLGDFNQTLPRSSQPRDAHDALVAALGPRLVVATAGLRDREGRAAIDHIAHTRDLAVGPLSLLPRVAEDGTDLSDHFGVAAEVDLTA